LELKISETDVIFNYQLEVGDKVAACNAKKLSIYCDIKSLQLLQGESYEIKITRSFKGQKLDTIITKNIKTLNATTVTSTSVTSNQVIYDNPKTITVNFDKDITGVSIKLEKIEGDKRTIINTTTVVEDKQVIITLAGDLGRDSSYVVIISELEAKDGSTLSSPYELDFKVSDGPTVSNVNIGSTSSPLSKTIVLTFDQPLSDAQNIANFVSVTGVSAKISAVNNQIFISYSNAPLCTDINIKVNPGLQSNFGIIQNDLWSFYTRTICYSVINIGYSVEGRSILAYIFGNGSQTVLFTGSIHGNELSSKYLMDAWINELELNAQSIPSNKKIVVIPTLNPDGLASGRRNNSNNVDINRNFPMNDWQTDIFSPANQLIYGGGGAYPLSEPESQAIANFTLQLQPRLIMSYHGNASYVIGDPWGDSAILAATYSQLSGYQNMTGVSGAFSYPITGTYDGWLLEKYGLMSIIIELSSNNNSEFGRNKAALWAMARY
jgi:protein MpaA